MNLTATLDPGTYLMLGAIGFLVLAGFLFAIISLVGTEVPSDYDDGEYDDLD